jgi:heat shock protein HslJ
MGVAIFIVPIVASVLAGCSNTTSTDVGASADIGNVWWRLEFFEPATGGSRTLAPAEEDYLVLFADTTLSGKDSLCGNTYNASCRMGKDDSISIGPISTTKIYCPSSHSYMDYLKALEKATSFQVRRDRLTIFHSDDTKRLEFVEQ